MAAQKGIGRLIQVGFKKEATRGTAETSAAFWTPWMDLTVDEKKDFATDAQSYGIIEDSVTMAQTKKWAQGSITGNFADTTVGLLLYSLFGGYSAGSAVDSTYAHTFTIGENAQHKSLTIFKHDPLAFVDYSYANGVVEKLELNVVLKQFVQFTASLMAMSGAAQSAFTPATTTENRFVPQYLSANFAPTYSAAQGAFYGTGTAATTIHVTAVSGFNCFDLTVGMLVTGTNITGGTTVAAIVSATAFDLSGASTGNAADLAIGNLEATCTASSTAAVTALSGVNALTQLRVGQKVYGKYVPVGAYITAIGSATAFTLSAATSGAASIIVFGPATVALKSVKLTANSNVESQDVIGSTSPADFLNKEFSVEGTMEAILQNETDFKTPYMAPASMAIRLDMVNSDVLIGAHLTPRFYVDLAKCYITEYGTPYKVKDLIYQNIKFKAVYSISDTLMVKAVLFNATSTY